jgi:hypothetical protein
MVLGFYVRDLPEAEVALLLRSTARGTRLEDLAGVEALGFLMHVGAATAADLRQVASAGAPVITPVHTSQLPTHPLPPWDRHCVVVVGATRRTVWIHDPSRARPATAEAIPAARFDAARFDAAWRLRGRRIAILAPVDPLPPPRL